jgi:peptidoglycan/LPS O-acetylase OafA/YrhL
MAGSRTVPALVAGAVLGLASAHGARRVDSRGAVLAAGAGLIGAAVIYPAARRELGPPAGLAVEAGVVLATTALAVAASRADSATGRRLVAAGWASHALFDFAQGPSDDSRLPGWYASLCAGFDFAYAVRLAV